MLGEVLPDDVTGHTYECDTLQCAFSVPQLMYLPFRCRIHLTYMDHLGAMKMSTSLVSRVPATDLTCLP